MKALFCAVLGAFSIVARAASDFAVETELSPAVVYLGGEAILSVRLLRPPGSPYGVLRPPALGGAADVWPLSGERWFEQVRDGAAWQVHERVYLIVPRSVGRIELPVAELEGPLRRSLSSAHDARPPATVLEVRPPPAGEGEPFLPARRVTLEESWSQDLAQLSAGTAVTRTLILRAEGIPARHFPRLEMAAQPMLRVHHDQPELSTDIRATGTFGQLVQRIVLVPLDEGEVVLPELRVRWWDVHADAPRIAALPARTLKFQAATGALETAPPPEHPSSLQVIAAAIALLLAAWLWLRARSQAVREARTQLRKACMQGDATAARNALIRWRSALEPGRPAPLVQLVGEAWDADARAQLWALDAAIYARRPWDGKKFWRSVRPWLRRLSRRRAARPAEAPFFRLQATSNDR